MKNSVQQGDVVSVIAPANVASGAGVLVGSLFGVAVAAALSGAPLELQVVGVVDLPKATGQSWTAGQLLYWSGTNVTNVASTNKLIGAALPVTGLGLAAGDTVGRLRLNGAAITV
jgi:predicted RecA/RadA family phage recombinase